MTKLTDLTLEQRELLMQRLHQRAAARERSDPTVPRLTPVSRDDALPLSFAQQRLWFLDQLEPSGAHYNLFNAVRLRGRLSLPAISRTLHAIVGRHEVLRTSFPIVGGRPVQRIAPPDAPGAPTLNVIDLRALPSATRESTALALAQAAATRPFDLARGPLLRLAVVRLDEPDHLLCMTMHHIVSDGWSMGVLIREIALFYAAFVAGQPPELPELPIQYADFAVWQRRWLEDAAADQPSPLRAQLAYWKRQLADADDRAAGNHAGPLASGGHAGPLASGGHAGPLASGGHAGPPLLDLPTDRPRPPVQTFNGANHRFTVAPPLSSALKALSRREDVTLSMLLLATFDVLLARYSGQNDIVVGTSIANRRRAEVEGLIGFFVNTLVLRADLSGNPPFSALLGRVRQVALDAYANQDLPFERLVEELQPTRDLARPPLFQVLFNLLNTAPPELELPGLTLEPLAVEHTIAKFDLTLGATESQDQLFITFEYNTDLFDQVTIARMAGHFQRLLRRIVADPRQRVRDLALLSRAERQQLLVEWNDTCRGEACLASTGASWCVHELFAAQAARTPDAVALVFDATDDEGRTITDERRTTNDEGGRGGACPAPTQHLTYAELDRRANQLAQHLRAHGVGPETLVAVCVERSPELLIALLGVLKAGGAYLPLDPTYPTERISFMLEDSGAGTLITASAERESGRAGERENGIRPFSPSPLLLVSQTMVDLKSDWPAITRSPARAPLSAVEPNNLAYVIYTSGSTGRPKGVQVTHGALSNFLRTMRRQPGLDACDTLLAVTTLSFDIAALELFLPLIVGARLMLVSRAEVSDGLRLAARLRSSGATAMQATPATWQMLLASGWPGDQRLRLFCGGEALDPALAAQLRARAAAVWNLYGPTETTIWSTGQRLHAATAPISIGRPIANTQVYVLDVRMRPAPIGVPGELCIGGAGLARGYLGRPDLAAARFIPNPFVNCKLQIADCRLGNSSICNLQSAICNRLYRTGDLARYLPDGSLAFLGRLDQQIKLRGFRIEPGEVAAALRAHPAVREAVVVLRDGRLVAYIVQGSEVGDQGSDEGRRTKDEGPPTIEDRGLKIEDSDADVSESLSSILYPLSSELRAFLAARLPAYMIPSAFVALSALPRTPSGKLDRAALPAPDRRAIGAAPFQPPRTQAEQTIAAIWREVLQVEQIGIDDNFFALGGHSLLATQVISRIRDLFEAELSVRALFEQPTVAGMAQALIQAQAAQQDAPVERIAPIDRDRAMPLLAQLDQLSDAGLDTLLDALLAEEES